LSDLGTTAIHLPTGMQAELDKVVRGMIKAFYMYELMGRELTDVNLKAALEKLNKKKTRK
jgi:hypothetical protein